MRLFDRGPFAPFVVLDKAEAEEGRNPTPERMDADPLNASSITLRLTWTDAEGGQQEWNASLEDLIDRPDEFLVFVDRDGDRTLGIGGTISITDTDGQLSEGGRTDLRIVQHLQGESFTLQHAELYASPYRTR